MKGNLKALLCSGILVTMIIKKEKEEILSYLEDASNFSQGRAEVLFIPENEEELREIILDCADKKMPLTISGAGTGTVGGRIPSSDIGGGILSLEKLSQIKEIDEKEKKAVLGAGVVVDEFLKLLEKKTLFYPPFPTERTAFIGGNVATNASGEYSLHFGATRRYVKRIKVFLSTGEEWNLERGKFKANTEGVIEIGGKKIHIPGYTSPPIKNSAGYYSSPGMGLIDIFIGSEGTLGVITEVEVKLIPALPPRFIAVAFFREKKSLEVVGEIKKRKDVSPLSLEYFDRESLHFLKKDFPSIPATSIEALYIEDSEENLEKWAKLFNEFSPVDTWISMDEVTYRKLIDLRHRLPENVNEYFKKLGSHKIALDIAGPEDKFPTLFNYYEEIREKYSLEGVLFEHIGENHLHFNLFPSNLKPEEIENIYTEAVKFGISLGGTVSAEHGIGKTKHKYLTLMYGEEGIQEMVRVKKEIDPKCILGLDNIFPHTLLQK